MYRVFKSMMAEMSYFLEKYCGNTSILWTVVFMAVCCAVTGLFLLEVVKYIAGKKGWKKRDWQSLYYGLMMIFSLIMNSLISAPQTWNSKLQRVMNNFNYVMTYPANYTKFFDALGLPCNEANRNGIFKISMFLNNSQWKSVVDAFNTDGDGGWYFAKVEKAFDEVLRLGGFHMSLRCTEQNVGIVVIIIIAALLVGFACKKKAACILLLAAAYVSIFLNLGTAIFLGITIYLGLAKYALDVAKTAIVAREEKPPEDAEKNGEA